MRDLPVYDWTWILRRVELHHASITTQKSNSLCGCTETIVCLTVTLPSSSVFFEKLQEAWVFTNRGVFWTSRLPRLDC